MDLKSVNIKTFSFFFFLLIFLFGAPEARAQFLFTKDLSVGNSSADVLELQKFLNSDSRTRVSETGPGSPGFESYYFGLKTKDAVIRFQNIYKNEVLLPSGLISGTGFVGKATRAKLNILTSGTTNVETKNTSSNTDSSKISLSISSVSSSTFSEGDTIAITGTGFENQNTLSLNLAGGEDISVTSTDGKTISATISTKMGGEIRKTLNEVKDKSPDVAYPLVLDAMKKNFFSETKDGVYINTFFVIKNSKGSSNQIPISIKVFSDK